ncbi:uncharacterized protein PV09_04415 [Verruconis gallopava]|uniref:Secreted protein n=1 Tax=Verruconis gallopava TaxID=253628 RepID=A0A0D2AZY7_9PEZI|nr:uncharacterized protein PV09_04415 [Verruconis gallopava]KIW04679.1 hypothetical protein PV09_04415 [Verruconis gallopava]
MCSNSPSPSLLLTLFLIPLTSSRLGTSASLAGSNVHTNSPPSLLPNPTHGPPRKTCQSGSLLPAGCSHASARESLPLPLWGHLACSNGISFWLIRDEREMMAWQILVLGHDRTHRTHLRCCTLTYRS